MIGLRPVALDLDRELEIDDGVVDLLVGEEDLADVVGGGGILGRDLEGLAEEPLGRLEIPALQGHLPQARKGLKRSVFLLSQVLRGRAVLVEDGLELGLRLVQVPFPHIDAADIQVDGVDVREFRGEFLEGREGLVIAALLEQGVPAVEEAAPHFGGRRSAARRVFLEGQKDGRVGRQLTDLDLLDRAEITLLGSGHSPDSGTQAADGEVTLLVGLGLEARPLRGLSTSTRAPGTLAPLSSTTSPLIRPRPRSSWAGRAKARTKMIRDRIAKCLMMISIDSGPICVS